MLRCCVCVCALDVTVPGCVCVCVCVCSSLLGDQVFVDVFCNVLIVSLHV